MLRSFSCLAFTGVITAFSLPLFAVSLVIAALGTAVYVFFSLVRRPAAKLCSDTRNRWSANEFRFERAIEGYEETIDAHAGNPV